MRRDARQVAFDVLRAVAEKDAYANLELAGQLRDAGLSSRDAALATELVGGTLRMQGSYDAVIDPLVKGNLQPEVRDALRLGAHQLLSMRIPTHAAVGTTVDLVKKRIGHRPSGLVNAVLRKISQQSLEQWLEGQPLGVRHSHPEWIVSALAEALGRQEELEALLAADNERPQVHLVARPGLATVDELGGRPTVSPYGVVLEGGDPGLIPAVAEGRAGVQDAGSQLVAHVCAEASQKSPTGGDFCDASAKWLDLCAGPGGKAALLAALAKQRGALLLANEYAEHRARLVRDNLRLTGGEVIVGDGTHPGWRPETFDRVLVDAPCSGLGALRRRPESRWRRTRQDVTDLVALQQALLSTAIASTKPGGLITYATCSPVVAETSEVVKQALASEPVEIVNAHELIDVADAACPQLDGAIQLWPHRHGTDAMFMAVLRRRPSDQ